MLAAACVVSTLVAWDFIGWFGLVFLYVAFSFLLLAIAYAGAGPKLLLKRTSGRRSVVAWALFGPYFVLNAQTFGIYRLLTREPAWVQIAPNVFFGRRLSSCECEEIRWSHVLDLAAEFTECRQLRELTGYQSIPVLDATAPTEEQLRSAVEWMTTSTASGPIYVHCALGHGRSACVVIAYLLSTGVVATVADGVKLLRLLRAGIRLTPAQSQRLRAFESRSGGTEG